MHLGYKPREWQRICHLRKERFRVFALHRRAGKTVLALMELIHEALGKPGGRYVYLAPFLKQAKAVAWGPLKERMSPILAAGAAEISEGELTITFANGATIRLFGADNPDAMRGLGLDGVVVDEVAQIKPEVWFEVVKPTLADRTGWALFIGTPKGVNLFSELYNEGLRTENWYSKSWTVYETEALPEAEVRMFEESVATGAYPDTAWRREFLCDFTASGEDQLISLADSRAAAGRVYRSEDFSHAPRVIGVDPARFGDDRSVIVRRQGLQMLNPIVYSGIDNMQLASAVAAQIEEWKPQAVFIDSGGGAGVIDKLRRELGHRVIEVHFGGKPTNVALFKNRRAEMWWTMAEWLRDGGAIPDDSRLIQELATPVYWFDPTGKRVLEPKDKIKERLPGAGSPDLADALALTFASPVSPKKGPLGKARTRRDINDYDPYSKL